MMWLSKFRILASMPSWWTKLPCAVKPPDSGAILRRGIQLSAPKYDRRRAGSTNLWSQVFPLIRNPDGSVNHRAAQQYVLMLFITFQLGLKTIIKMGEENKDLDEPAETTDHEADKTSTETVSVVQETEKTSTETASVVQETEQTSTETAPVLQETEKNSTETVNVEQETNKLSSADTVPK